jgi:hypothetical protein
MAEQTKNSIIITPENMSEVTFKGVNIQTSLSPSLDGDARKAGKTAEVAVIVDLTGATVADIMKYTAADFRVKINSRLKADAGNVDADGYVAQMQQTPKVKYTLADLETKREADPVSSSARAVSKFTTREQFEQFIEKSGMALTPAQIDQFCDLNGLK